MNERVKAKKIPTNTSDDSITVRVINNPRRFEGWVSGAVIVTLCGELLAAG